MAYPANIWSQLKSLSKGDLISALQRDGWSEAPRSHSSGSVRLFLKPNPDGTHRRVAIHFHASNDTMGRALLTGLLEDIGWTVSDLVRLKLVRR